MKTLKRTFRRDKGQSLVEYALIIALVSIAIVGGLTGLATGLGAQFTAIIGSM